MGEDETGKRREHHDGGKIGFRFGNDEECSMFFDRQGLLQLKISELKKYYYGSI